MGGMRSQPGNVTYVDNNFLTNHVMEAEVSLKLS